MTYKGIATATPKTTTTLATIDVPYPTGGAKAVAGEALVCIVANDSATPATLPAGWTPGVSASGTGAQTPSVRVFGIVATGSESGNLTVTVGNVGAQAVMVSVTGDFSAGFDVAGKTVSPSANTTLNIPTLTPGQANDTLLIGGTSATATGSFSPSASLTGFTEVYDDARANTVALAVDFIEYASASATGTIVLTRTTSIRSVGFMVAIKPLASNFNGTASLSGSGTLSATGGPAFANVAALSGSGSLSATGTPAEAGTAALSGAGSLTAAGTPADAGTASLSGTGTLSTTAAGGASGTAALSGSGTLTVATTPRPTGVATLSGTGTLVAAGSPKPTGTATLTGNGTLTTTGTPASRDVAALSGDGTLTTVTVAAISGAAALSGEGTLTAVGIAHIPLPHVVFIGYAEAPDRAITYAEPDDLTYAEHNTTITYQEAAT